MDQGTLVGFQIAEGKRLLTALAKEGIPVTGAAWLNKDDEFASWSLYIATPLVKKKAGTLPAYRRVNEVLRAIPDPISSLDLPYKLVAPTDPVGKAVTELQQHYPRRPPIWYGGMQYGVSTEGAYVYPPIVAETSDPS